MKIRNLIKAATLCLVLGLGVSMVQPAQGQPLPSLFQYAIFYNGLLEFSDCATMTVNGRVNCNSNIFVGTPSGSTLTFNGFVTTAGVITNAPNVGMSQSSWTGTTTYSGTPSPGWGTGRPAINLPIGSNSYAEVIKLPTAGETTNSVISQFRYYNKADLVILVTNIITALNGTNVTNVLTSVMLKSSMWDTSPLVFSYTNNLPTNTPELYTNWLRMTTNWSWFGASNWLTTNSTFYDAREGRTNHVTQIDIGRLGTWIATNSNALAKWNFSNPFNCVIYIADLRTTNQMFMDAVRLTNGQTVPLMGGASGLTVATINPLYIQGLYNCPSNSNINSTNTLGTQPCSLVCDALTLLSPAWVDAASFAAAPGGAVPVSATADTVNAAIIAGNVPSTGTSVTQFSGGVQNLPRLLENWSGSALWLNTSLVNLYPSMQTTKPFQKPSTYYSAPTRHFSFDQNFNTTSRLPPGTPILAHSLATVTLSNLNQVYDGTPRNVTVTTSPVGLNVSVTYGSNTFAPTAPGSYAVAATINDPVYLGSTTNLLVVSKGATTVTLTNLAQTYDGTAKSVSATTIPPGLTVNLTYNGSPNTPTNAGSYLAVATVTDVNYTGSVTNTLIIDQAMATVTLSNLSQTFDGTAKSVSVATLPPGLGVDLTYNGSLNAPTNAGSYAVAGMVDDVNYTGSVTNTLVITAPAPTPITLSGLTSAVDGSFQLGFTNTPGLGFSALATTDPTQPLTNWAVAGSVTEVSPGQYQFIDMQATNNSQQFYIIRSP